jgi:hypothetical protein
MADTKISALSASTTPLAGTEVLPIVQSGVTVKVAVSNLTAGRDIAATSLTTAAIQAASSAGGTLKNSSGTAQMQWGSGGGSNLSLEVATNINPANAAVSISPTGTGTVAISPAGALTINPTTASTINNTSIGATTASTGRFTSVTVTTGNVIIGTSGQGIDFSATPNTGTSELLDDYEEGAWTPVFSAATAPTGVTYNGRSGKYIKIGQRVTLWFEVSINSVGTGGSGDLRVEGMPYATANASPRGGMYFHYANGLANAKKFAGYIQSNSTFALGDSGGTGMTWADIGAGTLYMATMEYYVD